MIDFYSDNVTEPTSDMIDAVYGALRDGRRQRDFVFQLETLAAEELGKESAVLMPTGTQANLTAVLSQAGPGQEVIMGPDCHIYESEFGGASLIGGVVVKTWAGTGCPDEEVLSESCSPHYRYAGGAHPSPALVCFENTHAASGGTTLSPLAMSRLCEIAKSAVPSVHLDGSRIFNAAAATGTTAKEIARDADTVMFSLDKGLSAPYGAVLCGPEDVIRKARTWRRLLGGMVRKAGALAAAGIVALEKMVDRVQDDNQRAASIGKRLNALEGITIDPYPVPTNLVLLHLEGSRISAECLVARLEEEYGIRAHIFGSQIVRFAIHRHIGQREEDELVSAIASLSPWIRENRIVSAYVA